MKRPDIYQEVVAIIQEYLGPAADRYVQRLVEAHLKKSPDQLAVKDIPRLSEWIKVSLGLLTNDKILVDECEKRILKLAHV